MRVNKKRLPPYIQSRCRECNQSVDRSFALDGRCGYHLNWAKDILEASQDKVFHPRRDMDQTHGESFMTSLYRHELIERLGETPGGEAMLAEAAEAGKVLELTGFWVITKKGFDFMDLGTAIPKRVVVDSKKNFVKYLNPEEDKITFAELLLLGKGDYSQENYQLRKGNI